MTSSTQLKSRLKEIDLFLADAKLIQNSEDKEAIIKKYKGTEFSDEIQSILTARNAYEKVLVKYTFLKKQIQWQPVIETVVAPVIEEVVVSPTLTTKEEAPVVVEETKKTTKSLFKNLKKK
jgi:hypothetical protein